MNLNDPEFILLLGAIIGIWVRFEHRMTKVETRLENMKAQAVIDSYKIK